MASSYDLARAAEERKSFLTEQQALLQAEDASYQQDAARLQALHKRNREELSSYLLDEVSDAHLRALESRLSYPRLIAIKRQFEARLQDARVQLVELMKDPEAAHNDFHQSQLKDEMDEVRETHDQLQAQVGLWRASPHFVALHERGFFEPGYDAGILDMFRDWRAVSLLMEALEDAPDDSVYPTPDTVRAAWLRLWGQAEPIFELWSGLESRKRRLDALAAKRELLETAPTRLFQELYVALGDAVVTHLESLPDEAKIALVVDDKHLATFLQKDVGLQKQIQYLKELRLRRIQPTLQQLGQDISRLDLKIAKSRRKNKYVSDSDIAKMRAVKADSWRKRHERLGEMRGRIGGFNKYQKGSFTRDYLWWDAMTGGAPADDIYEVRVFRMNNPSFNHRSYDPHWDNHWHTPLAIDHAADALADSLGSGGDDLLMGDVS
jgi:hypothetical protein